MVTVTVIVPVLGRPERVEPFLTSLRFSQGKVELLPLFVCSPEDAAEIEAIEESGAPWIVMPFPRENGDYARKVNRAIFTVIGRGGTWALIGADDLCFCPGWADEALDVAAAAPSALVIGTNDLGNPTVLRGEHSTHSLVHVDYIEHGTVDEHGKLLHEGYRHNWVDNEFVGTARARGLFVFAASAYVEHLHPSWGKAIDDPTYRLGMREYGDDAILFQNRQRLWESISR